VKHSTSSPPTLRFGVFELNPRSGELRKQGIKIRLQGQPVEILAMLLEHPGETVTRDQLQKRLWPADTFVDFEQGLNNAMKRLRAALDDDADSPHFIETLPRHGYRFIGPVNGAAPASAPPAKPARGHRPAIWLSALGALAVIAAVAVLVGLNGYGGRDRLFPQAPKPRIQALAVLPLANLSGDPQQEYFADGMTEALITELSKISAPRVISRQSVMQYKGSKKPLQEIARELNVDAVLEGAVERWGGRVRVSIHLDQVSPESQLWANQYNRDIRDVLRLQDEIARTVTDEIQIKLTSQERALLTGARSVDPEAHDDYLRGRYQMSQLFAHWNSRSTGASSTDAGTHADQTPSEQLRRSPPAGEASEAVEDHVQLAIGYFKQAIQRDSAYALPYAGLADAYITLGSPWGMNSPRQILPQARAAATKAMELDPSLGEVHFSLAQISELYDWNWPGAEQEYRTALKLSPNRAELHLEYGRFLQAIKRDNEVFSQIEYAMQLDPFDPRTRISAAYVTYSSRQYDLASKQFASLQDDFGLGWVYREKKMYPEAIAALQRSVSESGRGPTKVASLADVYALAGRRSEALKLIAELNERARQHYVSGVLLAEAYGGLGERDLALTCLNRAYEDHDQWMVFIASYPGMDPLRPDPRFQALLRRMNFPQ
jgi:TolB-like protein/DNA-binding winged helix-turn-helix (wHTH) protein/tetratricopeptide (TPR) repeat protein